MSLDLVLLSGMSGAGKSTALKMLEDMGYFCVDNIPIPLIDKFITLSMDGEEGRIGKIALSVDIRSGKMLPELQSVLDEIQRAGIACKILFLEADTPALVKRYKETRRNHPLAGKDRLEAGIAKERAQLEFLKDRADYIIDTSHVLPKKLRTELEKIFVQKEDFRSLMVTVLSFGFKYGIPSDADLVFDVRFLPNPYYVPELRPKTGLDQEIRDFVLGYPVSEEFLNRLLELLRFLIPNYIEEGKSHLVIAVGCTGGRHRSVTFAEELYRRLNSSGEYGLYVEHRDIDRSGQEQN